MRTIYNRYFRRALFDERGQVIPWTGFMILTILGFSGLVVDVGRAYIAHAQLQNIVNASALAAAGNVYYSATTNNATSTAGTYSASTGDKNDNTALGTLSSPTIQVGCVNTLLASGSTCSSSTVPNAVQVTQSTTLKTYFMPIVFGPKTLTVNATATASMQGTAQSWNVAIIVDATDSMQEYTDSNCTGGTVTRFTCALESVQTLLGAINPCSAGTSNCATAGANFRVALFSFPNRLTSQVSDFYGCSGTIPTPEPYTFPDSGLSGYTALTYNSNTATYLDTVPSTGNVDANGFESDYYSGPQTLNSSAEIVKEIGGASGCQEMNTTGGENTYYGGVIYAAQDALVAEQKLHSGSQNAIILLSDGQANAANTKFPPSSSSASPSADGYSVVTNSTSNTGNLANPTTASDFGKYPDFNDQCQQAIQAGEDATAAGTTVFAVAYGSEDTGCTSSSGGTDSTLVATGNNASFTLSTLTPCVTMENIASSLSDFYSDYNQSNDGVATPCEDNSHPTVNLSDISLAIASTFTTPRLLPNNTFLYGTTQ
jgi:hypothetical protein